MAKQSFFRPGSGPIRKTLAGTTIAGTTRQRICKFAGTPWQIVVQKVLSQAKAATKCVTSLDR
eukprot:2739386-Amphidinium_carterae.1